MNELDILQIDLLYYLVDEAIRECPKSDEKRMFELYLLQHKLEVMKRTPWKK